ncbi:MAG: glycosyl transferase [Flavobacterium sp. BFFFF1]|uniref:glycosyltransferase family 2 protein n=1 Tax=unclassified Flavobacterium TaxID=196869 RepID=UPI000BCEE3B8|nr:MULTISPECIES: glycosyltransferase [unclassified Flavobacterium]OYU80802.1 MAG: glycosyl transferase [Flavobacterium sp. BFFFF1]
MNNQKKIAVHISTKNRIRDLAFTLNKLQPLLGNKVSCVVFDDGSTDNTFGYVTDNYPEVSVLRNHESKGYLYCRNKMLNQTDADFIISLDDDAHFVTSNPFPTIISYFEENPGCGVIAMRIYWGDLMPDDITDDSNPTWVKSFVGCAHAWRKTAWDAIPDYPEWFGFYGEEDFASYHLYKKGIAVNFVPEILVQHRVVVRDRKKQQDYGVRLRRSLRSGWYSILLFYPLTKIPGIMVYSIWIQFKSKIIKGDITALKAVMLACIDVVVALPKLLMQSNRFTRKEFNQYQKLAPTKIYWNPKPQR